jgi:hypothetical protein
MASGRRDNRIRANMRDRDSVSISGFYGGRSAKFKLFAHYSCIHRNEEESKFDLEEQSDRCNCLFPYHVI